MSRYLVFVLILLGCSSNSIEAVKSSSTLPTAETSNLNSGQRILEQAKTEASQRYEFAKSYGATIGLTEDQSSFWVLWLPPNRAPNAPLPPIIATLHGHGSYAFDEVYLWHHIAAERGMGILALQWWKGHGERFQDYLAPNEIYRALDQEFRKLGVRTGGALLHGFSRGSANIYAVTAFDRDTKNNYFALTIANAGKPSLDFPPNVAIENGQFGPSPFSGTHWVLYCGGKDPHPDRDGCPGMTDAKRWITRRGGNIALFLQDEDGGHGGFHRNISNMRHALDVFDKVTQSTH